MPTVMVYRYRWHNGATDVWRESPRYATEETIRSNNCQKIEGTGVEVDTDSLDGDYRMPIGFKPKKS